MIISRNIPLDVQTFLTNVRRDHARGAHSTDYRALLERETRARYPGLIEGLSEARGGRRSTRVIADADHIVPRSLWGILIPLAWNLPGPPAPPTPNVLSNLFWRTVSYNRGSEARGEALDQSLIRRVRLEARTHASPEWARQRVLMFLRHKHDEGVNIDVPVDPRRIDQMTAATDLSDVIEFVQRLRAQRPGISNKAVAEAVENRFPHIMIETDGRAPYIVIS